MATLGSTLINGSLTVSGNINGYKLAAAAAKDVDTSIASGSTSTNIPTSKAIVDYVTTAVNSWVSSNKKTPGAISVSTSVNSNKGLDITATASLTTGYYDAATLKGTKTIAAGSLTNTVSGSSSFTPTIVANAAKTITNSSLSTTAPESGHYYVSVVSNSDTAKTLTATAKATTGYFSEDTTKTATGTVSLNKSAVTYIDIPAATFGYNSASSGGQDKFIQCLSSGYVAAGALAPTGSYDKVAFNISYDAAILNSDGTSGILTIYSPDAGTTYDPGKNAATITPTISNFDAGYVGQSSDVLNNVKTTYIPVLDTTTTATYTKPTVTTTVAGSGAKLSSTATDFTFTVKNAVSNGSYNVTTTHALKDATTYKGSEYGLVKVGSEASGGNTITANKSADTTYYVQAGSNSVSNAATGIKTSTTDTGYSVKSTSTTGEGYQAAGTKTATTYIQKGSVSLSNAATGVTTSTTATSYYVKSTTTVGEGYQGASTPTATTYIKAGSSSVANAATGIKTSTTDTGYSIKSTATITDGYQGAGTKTATTYIQKGTLTAGSVSGAGSFTPVISKNTATNVSASDATTTKPSSGYYVAVNSASQTAKTISGTVSVSEGYVAAGSKTISGAVSLAESSVTYVPITSGSASISASNKSVSFQGGYCSLSSTNTSGIAVGANGSMYISGSITEGYIKSGISGTGSTYSTGTITNYIDNITVPSGKTLTITAVNGTNDIKSNTGTTNIAANTGTVTYLSHWKIAQSSDVLTFSYV